jgi:hypothetical protein
LLLRRLVIARRWSLTFLLLSLAMLAGCAGTRVARIGALPDREPLVTLVISQDRQVVERECQPALAAGPVLGCQSSRALTLPGGVRARAIKIVRFTDALPSTMALDIEAHELCHAIASLQAIDDPCHAGNDGIQHLSAGRGR